MKLYLQALKWPTQTFIDLIQKILFTNIYHRIGFLGQSSCLVNQNAYLQAKKVRLDNISARRSYKVMSYVYYWFTVSVF